MKKSIADSVGKNVKFVMTRGYLRPGHILEILGEEVKIKYLGDDLRWHSHWIHHSWIKKVKSINQESFDQLVEMTKARAS